MAPGPQDSEPAWPPRSPHEALLSTPKGRQRYREMLNQTSPSPSPARHTRALASIISRSGNVHDQGDDGDEDEDEETLQLKLQEIQARLKLKRLQNAKAKEFAASGKPNDENLWSESVSSSIQPRPALRGSTPATEEKSRPLSHNVVQVPASPVRKLQAPQQQTSPSRVLLGIDKGLKAKDISLKRAPSFRKVTGNDGTTQKGSYLQRSTAASPSALRSPESFRTSSFNERLASARTQEAFRTERQERIQKLRSNAFGIGKEEMEEYKKNAVDIPDEPLTGPSFTRDDILGTPNSAPGPLRRNNTVPNLRSAASQDEPGSASAARHQKNNASVGETFEEQSSFEPYSSIHLSKRILPHRVLARHVSGKKIFNIKDLLTVVKGPDFALPDIEQDIVVFAIVAKKSEPRAHKPATGKNGAQTEDRGKYMVMTLVDLEYELDLFLFNSGFEQYWKLTEGTVVAILNPNIMPPPPGRHDTGRFSLVINSDEDTILEIGSARDLGFCQSVKKDGQLCSAWVNRKRTQFCEFHSNEALRKQRAGRMEVNSSGFGTRKTNSREIVDYGKKKPNNYDWETKTHWFVSRGHSAAELIDGKDRAPADRKEKADFLKKSMESKERERDIMKKLGQVGNAAGKEYMQRSGSRASNGFASSTMSSGPVPSSADTFNEPDKPDAGPLGLLDKDREIHLSPVKRKRTGSSQAGSLTRSNSNNSNGNSNGFNRPLAFGWGSNLKDKLANMKEGEKLKPELPPVRKKTRFVTDKGIREAGRESLGNLNLSDRRVALDDDDDDDELVIVK